MGGWAIDSYGLRAAHNRSVLDRLHDTDRLHVSPLTWQPAEIARTSSYAACISSADADVGQLALVDNGNARSRAASLSTQLHDLHGRGVLVLVDDHECDPEHVAGVGQAGSQQDSSGGQQTRR
jgi:hypothetical protein